MKARMIDNLADEMEAFLGLDNTPEQKAFYDSIAGKVVTLTFTGGDAFEEADNDYWLPNHTWEPVPKEDAK